MVRIKIRVSIRHFLIKFVDKITSPQFHRWKLVLTAWDDTEKLGASLRGHWPRQYSVVPGQYSLELRLFQNKS